jgi:hypothetical protein
MSKVVLPTDGPVEIIGVELEHSVLGVRPAKLEALVADTKRALRRGYASGLQISALVGRWTWAMLCRRPALAVFTSVYRFIECTKRSCRIWPSVQRELLAACGLAPLLYADLTASYFDRIISSDASTTGQGVTAARLPPRVSRELVSRPPINSAVAYHHLPASSSEHDLISRDSLPRALRVSQTAPRLRTVNKFDIIARLDWREIISSEWVSPSEHINVRELRAFATALRWCLSLPASFGKRVVFFSDSSAVCGAITKGRSSSFRLLRLLRLISALSLSSHLLVDLRWIPSEFNPADSASRQHRSHGSLRSDTSWWWTAV